MEYCRAAAVRRTHHEYRVAFAGLTPEDVSVAMDDWLQRSNTDLKKASAQRKLVVLIPEIDESKTALRHALLWKIPMGPTAT